MARSATLMGALLVAAAARLVHARALRERDGLAALHEAAAALHEAASIDQVAGQPAVSGAGEAVAEAEVRAAAPRPTTAARHNTAAAASHPKKLATVSFDDMKAPSDNRKRIEAAMAACTWEDAGSIAELTATYRKSDGVWLSEDCKWGTPHFPAAYIGVPSGGMPTRSGPLQKTDIKTSARVEVCFAPPTAVTGWADPTRDADPTGTWEERLVFTRIPDLTIPPGESLELDFVPAVAESMPNTNRFLGLHYGWMYDANGEPASYPPLFPHHTSADMINYPPVDAVLSTSDPFIYLSLGKDALSSQIIKFNGTQTMNFGRLTYKPSPTDFCKPPEGETNRPLCDSAFQLIDKPTLMPAEADAFDGTRIDNMNKSVPFSGAFVLARQYLFTMPAHESSADIKPYWEFLWKTGEGVLLNIPPARGPSFAAHTYVVPRSGSAFKNGPHTHGGVQTDVWFVVGANVSELVPSEFKSYIYRAHHFGKYRDGGFELTAPVASPYGDTGPVMLAGTGYEDDNGQAIREYVRASLPDPTMLKCIWHSVAYRLADGTVIDEAPQLDASTPDCAAIRGIAAGTPVTVFSFFESSVEPDWYTMHTLIKSEMLFDDDPFLVAS